MKRAISILLAIMMVASMLTACGGETAEPETTPAATEPAAEAKVLKVLTLGHSLAVDSGHMLNLVANAEGYDQPMEIATLYYSGCPLYKHVNYIKNNSAVYDLYVSSTTTPDEPPVIIKGVTMKYGLKYADWDIIIMQGGPFEICYDSNFTNGNIQTIKDYVNQHKTNPNSILAWHMPWAPPTTNSLRDQYPYQPNTYYSSYEKYGHDRMYPAAQRHLLWRAFAHWADQQYAPAASYNRREQ